MPEVYAMLDDTGRICGISRVAGLLPESDRLLHVSSHANPESLMGRRVVNGIVSDAPEPEPVPERKVDMAKLWAALTDDEQDDLLIGRTKHARRLLAWIQVGGSLPRDRVMATLADVFGGQRASALT